MVDIRKPHVPVQLLRRGSNTQDAERGSVATSPTAGTCATTTAPTSTPAQTRVFVNSDFAHTEYEDCHLTLEQFEAYKRRFLGKPVPLQTVSNDSLVALGYDLPEPWIPELHRAGSAKLQLMDEVALLAVLLVGTTSYALAWGGPPVTLLLCGPE